MLNVIMTTVVTLLISCVVKAEDFKNILKLVEKHEIVHSQLAEINSINEVSKRESSLGDPSLSVAAVNFPINDLRDDLSMMTGIKFGLIQKITISNRNSQIRNSYTQKAISKKAKLSQYKRELAQYVWRNAIEQSKLLSIQLILKENLEWIKGNLKISKRLYSTGKLPQQAVLDIQIRKSELKSDLHQIKHSLLIAKKQLNTILSTTNKINLEIESIPWSYLEQWNKELIDKKDDFKLEQLKANVLASEYKIAAKNNSLIPDIKMEISYTKRNNIDNRGDFVGASLTFPLPTSTYRYSDKAVAIYKSASAKKKLQHYEKTKPSILEKLALEIEDYQGQLSILTNETLKYAKSSRDVVAKSYARGGSDYLELLRSELQYQKQQIKRADFKSNLNLKKINYLYVNGGHLLLGQ